MCFIQFLFQIKQQQQHRIDYESLSAFSCLLSREGAISQTASLHYSLSCSGTLSEMGPIHKSSK